MSDFGSGGSSLATDFTPTDCAPRTGPAGGNCTSIYVSTVQEICLLSAGSTCAAGHEAYETAGGPQAGFAWGIFLSLFGDVIISIGLALQKVACCIALIRQHSRLASRPLRSYTAKQRYTPYSYTALYTIQLYSAIHDATYATPL